MNDTREMSTIDLAELEGLRGRIFKRNGMHSAMAAAYEDRDLDMFRAFDRLLYTNSPETKPEDIYRAVLLLRYSHGVHDVSPMMTEAHVGLQSKFYTLIRTAQLMSFEEHNPEVTRQAIHGSVIFAYQNMHLLQHIESILKLHVIDPQEVREMALSLAESSPALVEGAL